jgi:(E)-4-hydroxy-3-methylbut-2-enyl-diphosphate synthase
MIQRRQTKQIFIGQTPIGGGAPITVQSMTNTDTRDAEAAVRQIKGLEEAGCEIIRVAVPDMAAAEALRTIRGQISIPLIGRHSFRFPPGCGLLGAWGAGDTDQSRQSRRAGQAGQSGGRGQ